MTGLKRNSIRYLIPLSLGFALHVANAVELAVPSLQCACNQDEQDKLEEARQINFGAFSGQCVDSCRFRKSNLLASKGKTVLISNFLHDGIYWKARIPVDHIRSVDVGFEEFLPGVSHVFLLFHFSKEKPVLLYPQVSDENRSPTKILTLVISPEGIPPKDTKYNFYDAFMQRYPIGIRILSKEQVISTSVVKHKHKIRLFNLRVTADQGVNILVGGLESIDKKSFKEKYVLFSNNCATKVADLVDAVIKPEAMKHPFYFGWLYPLERALPILGPLGTLQVFLSRDLIDLNSSRQIL